MFSFPFSFAEYLFPDYTAAVQTRKGDKSGIRDWPLISVCNGHRSGWRVSGTAHDGLWSRRGHTDIDLIYGAGQNAAGRTCEKALEPEASGSH
jgi:hypothetical protein